MSAPRPELYAHPFSSYCQKALIALYEKEIDFTFRMVSPEDPSAGEELKQQWPLERFPVLTVGDKTLVESTIIIEWADLNGAGPRLIPTDPDAALEVRMLDRIFDNYVMTPMQKLVFDRIRPEGARDPYGVDEARALLDRVYPWLERTLQGRTWAAGERFSLSDCAAGPSLFYADWTHPFDGYPALQAYFRRLRQRPSFARCIEAGRPFRAYFPGGVPDGRD